MTARISKVSGKGLTTIPKEIRKLLGIEIGMDLIWEVIDDKIIVKIKKDIPKFLKGKYNDLGITFEESEGKADELIAEEARNS
jgi:bifunctional DNA-binding transcriptional regulator/antitoxin component of YhaV-PrlF toxin-antitoxin module